jgi:hypothetical protein
VEDTAVSVCVSATACDCEAWVSDPQWGDQRWRDAVDYVAAFAREATGEPHPCLLAENWPAVLDSDDYRRIRR